MPFRALRILALAAFVPACGSGTLVGSSCSSDSQCGDVKCLRDKRASGSSAL